MTATTVPEHLGTRSWNSLTKAAALVVLFVVLVAGSFAIGRSTADGTTTEPGSRSVAPANVAPVPDPASCGHTAHTPPC